MVLVAADRKYTHTQGQYLAYIYYYTKIHGFAPAEGARLRVSAEGALLVNAALTKNNAYAAGPSLNRPPKSL